MVVTKLKLNNLRLRSFFEIEMPLWRRRQSSFCFILGTTVVFVITLSLGHSWCRFNHWLSWYINLSKCEGTKAYKLHVILVTKTSDQTTIILTVISSEFNSCLSWPFQNQNSRPFPAHKSDRSQITEIYGYLFHTSKNVFNKDDLCKRFVKITKIS